ncbi:MAG: hypothetical protein U0836_20060 [Pirellulales bacterium]
MVSGMEGMVWALFFAIGLAILVSVVAGAGIAWAVVRRTGNRMYWWLVPLAAIVLPFVYYQLIVFLRWT